MVKTICVFICFVTRDVHFELVADLYTEVIVGLHGLPVLIIKCPAKYNEVIENALAGL